MDYCLVSNVKENVDNAQEKICRNLGLPNEYGTKIWGEVKKVPDDERWFIMAPPMDGWGNDTTRIFTYDQIMQGIVDVDILQLNADWLN
jgi:hypothetical protein